MKPFSVASAIVLCLCVASLAHAGQVAVPSEQNAPDVSAKKCGDFTSAELAPAVAQTISRRTAEFVINRGATTEGVAHETRLFQDTYFYDVAVDYFWIGYQYLTIHAYLTNRDFSELQSPADAVAEELSMGPPLVHFEQHFYDRGIDGTAEIYQDFSKRRGSTFDGFTRRERDLGKKAGVSEYLHSEGRAYRDGKKLNVKKEQPQDVTEMYFESLTEVAHLLGVCDQ